MEEQKPSVHHWRNDGIEENGWEGEFAEALIVPFTLKLGLY